jgi:RNA polymerase sigma-70 factor (ECF subfamily)
LGSDENSLVLRAQAGDKGAFKTLVERYQRRVYGIAFGIVRDPEDAMDVTQEAFIKVHRYLDRFKGSSSFYTWLYRIVVNLAIDHLRRRGKSQTVDYDDTRAHDDDSPHELAPSTMGMNPDRSLMRSELRSQVNAALERLSPNHRAAILMREVEGLSYTEMAEAMNCSKGTIMSRLFHARRNLQRALIDVMGQDAPDLIDDRQDESRPRRKKAAG